MIYNNLSLILRSVMIQMGFLGFLIGFGMGYYYAYATLPVCLLRGTALCVAFAYTTRGIMMTLFRSYLVQYELRDSQ